MNKRSRSGLIVFLIILLILAGLVILSFEGAPRGRYRTTPRENFFGQDYVAVLSVNGVIQKENKSYNQEWLLGTIDDLKGDPKNLGTLVAIDSPGGSVYESDEVYLALRAYGKEKPLRVFLGPLAASGGYYIACAADRINANRNTLTGSIGVISSQSVDLTELMAKYGVSVTTITAGKNKNMLNYNSPLTDEQREIMQAIADECYDQFVGIVAESRGLEAAQVRTLADGRIYTAKQAKEVSLIDDIATFDETLGAFRASLIPKSAKGAVEVEYFDYAPRRSLMDMLFAQKKGGAKLEALTEVLFADISYPAFIYQGGGQK